MVGSATDGFETRRKRLRTELPTLVMIGIAAGLSWFIAENTFGDEAAVFAPVAAALTLGLTEDDATFRVAISVAVAVAIGLTVADALVGLIGVGAWQLGVVVALARLGTMLVDDTSTSANQATVTAVLVVALHDQDVFPGDRFIDALIGAGIALACAAILRRIEGRTRRSS